MEDLTALRPDHPQPQACHGPFRLVNRGGLVHVEGRAGFGRLFLSLENSGSGYPEPSLIEPRIVQPTARV